MGRRFRCNQMKVTVINVSVGKSVRTAVGVVVADEAARRRKGGIGNGRRKRDYRTATGCVTSVDMASSVRRWEGTGELPS